MAKEIEAAGKGFLTSAGQLKDKKAIAAEDNKEAKKSSQTDKVSDTEDRSVSSALKPVRSRFNEDINSVITVANENDENLKKASKVVKQQLETAQELKQAIKDGDQKKTDLKRQELEELNAKRDQISAEIEKDNQRLNEERTKSVSLGNKQIKTIQVEKVKFEKSEPTQNLDKAKDVDNLIQQLKSDKQSIKAQKQDLREVKKEIKTVVKDVRVELNQIEQKSIQSIDEANIRAEKLAKDITKAGTQQALVSNIDESVAEKLLAA